MPALLAALTPLLLLLTACAAPSSDPGAERLGPALRRTLAAAPADSVLSASARAAGELTSEQRADVEALGARVQTVIGDVFTVRGTPEQLRAVAALPFVRALEGGRAFTTR